MSLKPIFLKLSRSSFRSRFQLSDEDLAYLRQKGRERVRGHARDFIYKRFSAAVPKNDGKQTPFRGHPVFIAQHATATCCRSCLAKWHDIRKGVALTQEQQKYILEVIMEWINRNGLKALVHE